VQASSFAGPREAAVQSYSDAFTQYTLIKKKLQTTSAMAGIKMPNEPQNWQTQNGAAHKNVAGSLIDKQLILAQKERLRKSNFIMGQSPQSYKTTADADYSAKEVGNLAASSQQKILQSKTNFTA
jgi:hypothetical protein